MEEDLKVRIKCRRPEIEIDIPDLMMANAYDVDHLVGMVTGMIAQEINSNDLWNVSPDDMTTLRREFIKRRKQGFA